MLIKAYTVKGKLSFSTKKEAEEAIKTLTKKLELLGTGKIEISEEASPSKAVFHLSLNWHIQPEVSSVCSPEAEIKALTETIKKIADKADRGRIWLTPLISPIVIEKPSRGKTKIWD